MTVQRKFPNSLTKLKVSLDCCPLNVTLQIVKKHFIDKAKKDDTASTTYEKFLWDHLDLKYEPNKEGPTEYFKSQKNLPEKIEQLEVRTSTAFAKDTLLTSGHDCTHIATSNIMWDTDNTMEK